MKKDPTVIPRKSYFFEHDDRDGDKKDDDPKNSDSTEAQTLQEVGENPEKIDSDSKPTENSQDRIKAESKKETAPPSRRFNRRGGPRNQRQRSNLLLDEPAETSDGRWTHDRFDPNDQRPKSKGLLFVFINNRTKVDNYRDANR